MDPSINIVKKITTGPTALTKDQWVHTTNTHTLGFCLKNMYFLFQGKYYEQVHGAGMGSPLSHSLPNCLWKSMKSRPLALSHTPHLWLRYVDDAFVIQEAKHSHQLLQHINSQDSHIQLTIEEPNQVGTPPLLDTLVSQGPSNTLVTTVYRKPTHTDQYLHWDNNHFITAEMVFSAL